MSADKPVSLADRVKRLPLFLKHSLIGDAAGFAALEKECHALEADAKELEFIAAGKADIHADCNAAEARVEALEEVLREAPEPPNFAGLANLGVDPWTWVEHYREWYESRAAALAGEPRKEPHEAD